MNSHSAELSLAASERSHIQVPLPELERAFRNASVLHSSQCCGPAGSPAGFSAVLCQAQTRCLPGFPEPFERTQQLDIFPELLVCQCSGDVFFKIGLSSLAV